MRKRREMVPLLAGLLLSGVAHMPRRILPPSSAFPYHVTGRSHNQAPFPLQLETTWEVFEDFLFLSCKHFGLRIHSFVLMPNHFHLLVTTPGANLSEAMRYLLTEFSREIGRLSGSKNQVFGNRHYKTLVQEHHYFMNAYKYVYRNPVKARLVEKAEDYPFSTLSGKCGRTPLRIPVVEDSILFNPNFDEKILNWINRVPKPEDETEMCRALNNKVFEFKPCRNTQKKSDLENRLY